MTPSLPPFSRFRRSWKRRLRTHFQFEIDGVRITYCYVRKNGCSAFKRLMLDLAGYSGPWKDALDVMHRDFPVSSTQEAAAADWRVFVYRDPFSRTASLFRNKMIMQHGAEDLLKDFEEVTSSNPKDATFSSFIDTYIAAKPIDPHTWPQIDHVLPVDYNAHCTLHSLEATMSRILGQDCAAKYFSTPNNASSDTLFDEPSDEVPVEELRRRYATARELPSESALGAERLRQAIHDRYHRDYGLKPR